MKKAPSQDIAKEMRSIIEAIRKKYSLNLVGVAVLLEISERYLYYLMSGKREPCASLYKKMIELAA